MAPTYRTQLLDENQGYIVFDGVRGPRGWDVVAVYAQGERLPDRQAAKFVRAFGRHVDQGLTEAARMHRSVRRNPERDMEDLGEILALDAQFTPAMRSGYTGMRTNPSIPPGYRGRLQKSDYPGLFDDADADGVPNVDDAYPHDPTRRMHVEETQLSDEIHELILLQQQLEGVLEAAEASVRQAMPGVEVYGRAKTPYSLINKLRRKRITGPKGLTDTVAMTAVAEDAADLRDLVRRIDSGQIGEVLEKDDFYLLPKGLNGYRAVHYILTFPSLQDATPVELQVKTRRQKLLSAASHEAYKKDALRVEEMNRIGKIIVKADEGDPRARVQADRLLTDPNLPHRLGA